MPRKRHYDLRAFWPWYERQWPTRGGLHATPPPFELRDISQMEQPTPTGKPGAMFVVLVVLAIGMVVWGLFFA